MALMCRPARMAGSLPHPLEVEGEDQESPEEAGGIEERPGRGGGEGRVPEETWREHRLRSGALHPDEQDEPGESGQQRSEHRGRAPATLGPLDEAPGHRCERERGDELCRQVQVPAAPGQRRPDEARRQHDAREPERKVHQEDASPPERRGQQTPDQGTAAAGDGGERAPDADGMGPLSRLGVGAGEQRERGRHEERRAEPLQHPRGDQQAHGRREPAEQRRHGEQRQAAGEDALRPEPVAEAAGQQGARWRSVRV